MLLIHAGASDFTSYRTYLLIILEKKMAVTVIWGGFVMEFSNAVKCEHCDFTFLVLNTNLIFTCQKFYTFGAKFCCLLSYCFKSSEIT